MSEGARRHTGGCLCGALRYEFEGEPVFACLCYCADCRKASGSGFVPVLAIGAGAVRFSGRSLQFRSKAANGNFAVRNFCPLCGGLVFGGVLGESVSFNIYAGSLDDPSFCRPTVAIFTRGRPSWALIPPGLKVYEALPTG